MKTPNKYDDSRPAVDGDRTLLAKLFLGLVHLVTNIKYPIIIMIIPAYDDDNEIHYLPNEVDESLS